ncbi:MAG: ABC transporter ATP-binding protein/permease [Terrisporobacter sp.]|uniref:ABC transporter ATP-binding protein/permease n=1 Tax=Terrisporobacter sp. TaxID=1965305 RepID=UPI002A44A378|nr:ABC transporter ATP-binding protein/permease [Terrisporobacter sp.]MCI5630363.1 ABC transporter ATP-binding protein/permease [Clostridium sp.]MDD5879434.1 ABC transporter ATP-binding protein/permease [Clostridiales bacterium]MDY6154512.1 ABC transporter ATP-binding protein/permease [Terrisporobacter sp.]
MFNKRLLSICDSSKKWIGLTVLMNWISIICNIALILFIGTTVDKLMNGNLNLNVISTSLFIIAMLSIRFVANFMSTKFSLHSSSEVKKTLRSTIYEKLLSLGVNYTDAISTSSTVQIAVDGVEQLEIYFGRFMPQLFYSLLAPLTLFAVMSFISFKTAIVLLICVPLIPMTIMAVMKIAKKLLSKYWGVYTDLGDSFLENLQGLTTLKIFDIDEDKNKEMNDNAEHFRKITMKVLSMQLNSITIMDLIAFGGSAIGILIAIAEFRAGLLTAGQVLIIILLSAEFFIPMRLLGSFFHVAMNGISASERMFKLLDTEVEEIKDLDEAKLANLNNINIELRNVDFSYDKERKVLENINIEMKNNKMIALVGESGCGKSTITNLLLKQNKVDSGEILLNGINLNEIPFDVLTKKVGFINHSAYIFNGSIEDNIRMGKNDASYDEIYDALKKANLYEFVMSLPEKLNTNVGEGGSLLSGGQKQRLALARTIITDPEIYIFDEATSNIDVESEEKVWESIYKLSKNKTVIVISHRLANVKNAHAIYVLDKGHIVEHGKHKELMMTKNKYYELVTHQQNLENIYREENDIEEVAVNE